MPFVSGFLRLRRRGHPDQGLPGEESPVDPDYGVDVGEPEGELPDPPPGIWPPLTPEQPWRPIDPGFGVGGFPDRPSQGPVRPGIPVAPGQGLPGGAPGAPDQGLPGAPPTAGHLPALPPGTIWPPLPPGVHGKYLALVLIGGGGKGAHYRYVVVDADQRPSHPIERPPTAQPK